MIVKNVGRQQRHLAASIFFRKILLLLLSTVYPTGCDIHLKKWRRRSAEEERKRNDKKLTILSKCFRKKNWKKKFGRELASECIDNADATSDCCWQPSLWPKNFSKLISAATFFRVYTLIVHLILTTTLLLLHYYYYYYYYYYYNYYYYRANLFKNDSHHIWFFIVIGHTAIWKLSWGWQWIFVRVDFKELKFCCCCNWKMHFWGTLLFLTALWPQCLDWAIK
jgi:hypothetical protein